MKIHKKKKKEEKEKEQRKKKKREMCGFGNYSDNGDFTFESADPQRPAERKARKQGEDMGGEGKVGGE